ncbi:TetR/AcrR family transcriptional regulator [Microbacterium thalassium]|uniref:AcrR family transcriptional regulator n=1 Tax=Microbacterium thalassium TaxID=362649 RepID=A0A7X0KVW3_9MICO|nr:TetR/AcrR family transcriptional regulator C-terminal domain-containing protein [Microbacterium thalassium]MBB6392655.1 AcrR family transcriptional regulator [Microbacterium thalassium]GLK23114.1 TetR family transcriptional regulator [Microbacterium thalassium]
MSSPDAARTPLSRARVAEAAVALADDVGLDGTTMRRLADDLGVTPMALYKHVANREELVDAMVDHIVGEMIAPDADPDAVTAGTWKSALRAQVTASRAVVLRHPWSVEAIETRTLASPVVLAYMDRLMRILFAGGLSADLVHHAMHALSTRMWGFTRDVLPTPSMPDDPAERASALAGFAEAYPGIVRMATTAPHAGAECDSDAEFAFALEILLDSFERLHAAGWSSVPAVV